MVLAQVEQKHQLTLVKFLIECCVLQLYPNKKMNVKFYYSDETLLLKNNFSKYMFVDFKLVIRAHTDFQNPVKSALTKKVR